MTINIKLSNFPDELFHLIYESHKAHASNIGDNIGEKTSSLKIDYAFLFFTDQEDAAELASIIFAAHNFQTAAKNHENEEDSIRTN